MRRLRLATPSQGTLMEGVLTLPAGASTVELRLTPTRRGTPDGAHHAARGTAPGAPRDTALDVVRRYHQAWTTGDVEGAMRYVADDIFCRAPEADIRGKEAYQDYIASFAPELTGIGEIAEMVEVPTGGSGWVLGREGASGAERGDAPACPGDQRAPRCQGTIEGLAEETRVALFYYPQTVVTSTTPAAELFTVRSGRITESVLAFDRLGYAPTEPGPAPGPAPASPGTEGAPAGSVGEPEGHEVPAGAPGAGGGGEPGEGEVPGRAEGESRGGAGGSEGVRSS